ncbi:PREDICTED: uncharacterized protein LOC106807606 [Priapulus caudatus]|uniref:Uncharacterized protein LOC106807606 n=1 Tax=Priapulus caudatus TaxID=37621 RepID=A0ABM1DZW5_PRICU|nr:PREDICTED: uncharacterized protein LOC106807606 [Priapulus caudatus]
MSGFGSDAVLWYSNIALVAVSGLVVIVSVVVGVVVGRCKVNSDCRSVQKFVLSLLVEAGIGAFLPGIIYSFVQVMKWEWLPQLCGGLTWSFTAVVFLQAATAASAILDRIYAVHWEFRYKYFVNQAQAVSILGAVSLPTIAPYRTLVEHVAIWVLTAKGLLLAMIVILGDSRYRRFACSCKRRTASSPGRRN